jgi:hypothetical protein
MITETEKNLSVAMAAIPMITSLPGWHAYEIATWASVATFCAIMVWAGWGLMRYRVPASVRAVLYAVWGVPVLSLFVDMYFASAFLGVDPSSALDATSIGKTIGALFWAGVWTAYFKFSRRVKNTYYEGLQVVGPRAHPVEERREPRL